VNEFETKPGAPAVLHITPLLLRLFAIVIGIPLAVLALYAWLFPLFQTKTPFGVIAGALIAGGLSFQFIKRSTSIPIASRFASNLVYSRSTDPPQQQQQGPTIPARYGPAERQTNSSLISPPAEGKQEDTPGGYKRPLEANVDSAVGQPYLVYEGSVLDTVLMNRLDGDAVGPVKVLVSNPLYSHDHQHVIIPEGTVVLGEAKKIGAAGFGQQRRMAVVFHRLIMPDGYSVDLDQFQGLDQIGEEGLKDKVNNHYLQIFGTSIALGGVVGRHDRATTSGPTIIIGRKGSIGEVNWSSGPCFPIDTTYYIENPKTSCDLRWLFFMLLKLDLTRLNKSAAVPGLNRDDAYEQLIPFPDLFEQQRVAARLERVERLQRTRRYALELSATILPAAFRELFGSPRAAAERFPSAELGEVTDFIDYRGIAPNKTTTGVRLVTARNIKRGYFEIEPQEFIPAEEYSSWMTRGMPRPGDVLFTTEGHTLGSAAKLPSFNKVALAQRLIALQPKGQVTSDYLLYVILHPSFQDRVVKHSTGSAAVG
jgi:hypothetical protein